MGENWNNVELTNLSRRKSYTLNHEYDAKPQSTDISTTKSNDGNGVSDNRNEGSSVILQPGSSIKPNVNAEDIERLLRRLYGITIGELKELISYDDRNYLIKEDRNVKNPLIVSHWPYGYVLKILNALDSKKLEFVEAQNELMMFLAQQGIQGPRPVENVNGKYYSLEHLNGGEHIVRLLEYIPGNIFHEVPKTNHLLYQSGEYLAKIDRALKHFNHVAYETHRSAWHLQSIPQLRDFIYVLKDLERKLIVEEIIEAFESRVLNKLDSFKMQIIHGDFNEQNVIVDKSINGGDYRVVGIIDFGDTHKSPIIFEVGIALTYILLQTQNLESGGIFLAGYQAVHPLNIEERMCLKYCVAARLAQSLVMGIYTHSVDPSNEYVLVTQEQGWKLIEELWRNQWNQIDEIWQESADRYLTQSVK